MRVFISWSGEKSRQVAEQLRDWIPLVIQSVRPYFSPEDIEKGARWSSEIANELSKSEIGIICVTRDNIHRDWLLFEAGALSKAIEKSRVCPILFGITNADISGPLKQFQSCSVSRNDFLRLMNMINNQLGDHKLPAKVLDRAFDLSWNEFEERVNFILSENTPLLSTPVRSDREIIEEILALSRKSVSSEPKPASEVYANDIKEIIRFYITLCNQQEKEEGGYQDCLDILKQMQIPLMRVIRSYIIDHGIKDLAPYRTIIREMTFDVKSKKSESGLDDEIPF